MPLRSSLPPLLAACVVALLPGPEAQAAPTEETKTINGRQVTREEFTEFAQAVQGEAQFVEEMKGALDSAFGVSKASAGWEQLPRYLHLAPPVDVPEREALAALKEAGPLAMEGWFGKLKVHADFRSLPNYPLATVLLKVDEVRDARGRKVKFTVERPPQVSRLDSDGTVSLELVTTPPMESFAELDGWKGKAQATVQLPIRFKTVSFTPADVGQAKQGITLVSWKDRKVVLDDPSGALAQAEPVALSAEGQRFERTGSDLERPERKAFIDKLARTKWEDLPARVDLPEGKHVQVSWTFAGKPSRLDVHVVEKRVERKVTLALAPQSGKGAAPGAGRTGIPPRILCNALTAEQLQQRVRVFATRSGAMVGHGEPQLAVQLPACDNSAFSDVDFAGLQLLDAKGATLPAEKFQTQAVRYEESYGHELRLSPKVDRDAEERPDPAFREVAEVRGTLKLTWPRLRIVELGPQPAKSKAAGFVPDKAPATLKVRMPQATYEAMARDNTTAKDRFQALTAYDAKGRQLPRPQSWSGMSEQDGDFMVLTTQFLGKPARLEAVTHDGLHRVEVPFSLKLPPPPEPRQP